MPPRVVTGLVLGLAASLGLPGLAGFWGEFFSVYAAWLPAGDRPRALAQVQTERPTDSISQRNDERIAGSSSTT